MCQSIWIVLILKTGRINKINKNLNRKKNHFKVLR